MGGPALGRDASRKVSVILRPKAEGPPSKVCGMMQWGGLFGRYTSEPDLCLKSRKTNVQSDNSAGGPSAFDLRMTLQNLVLRI